MVASGTRSADAEVLIDDFASVLGRTMGWPPMAGRTAGVLMLAEGAMSAQQLQAEVGASAGSMSEITRLLITNGVVRRVKAPGARHFVYEWRADAWVGCLEHQLGQTRELRELAHRAEETGAGLSEAQRRRLRDMAGYYDFMVARVTALLEDYRADL
jgi:DNA-binding transcriptional regulator GbsR (MarR family)